MAIIYSYPVVDPTLNDLVLGTDVDAQGKPTKNFTIQSIVSLIQGSATGLEAVLADSPDGGGLNILNIGNITGSGVSTSGSFADGTMTISSGTGVGFVSITSTDFVGNITGIVKVGSSIAGAADGVEANNVTGITQPVGTSNTTLATTKFVMDKVDPSVLQYLGDSTGPFDLNLVTDDFKISGTANQIETTATTVGGNVGTINLKFPIAGVTLPDGSVATTQALTDNSTDVATTAFVHGKNDAQDLDFTGDTGTSSVLLNSQTLDFEGTADQVTTAVTAQKVKLSLPTTVIRNLQGNVTGTILATSSIAGLAGGTDAQNVLAVTQTAGDDSTRIATTAYVDTAAGAKILQYQGDTGGPFDLNLKDDDLDIAGGSNISTTAATVAANLGVITIDLNDSVTISGTSKADTFTTTAGTATWVTTVLDGFTAITSDLFTGPLVGNADTATALASSGALSFGGEVTLSSSTPSPATYTSGGNITLNLGLNNAAVIGKVLTGLSVPATGNSIEPDDSILSAFGKLQAQHNTSVNGLRYIGTWDARTQAEGGAAGDEGNPALADGGGVITTGTNTSVVADQLVDSTKNFTTLGVTIGERVYNQAGAFTTVSAVGTTTLTLDEDIFLTNGQTYSVDNNPALNQGEYYVVNQPGTVDLNGNASWAVGDWVIAGAGNTWEKLDQTGVDGTGSINRIPRWDTVSSLNDSIILQDSAGIKIDSGKTLTTQGTGGSLAVGGAATISGLTTASAALSLTGGVNLPTGGYGAANQVLGNANAAGAVGNDLVWITPTDGTLTDVDAGDGIVIDKTDPAEPVIAIDYLGADNAILSATDISTGTIDTTDQIWFNDVNTGTVTNTVKYAPVSKLPFDNYNGWILSDNVSTPNTTTIVSGGTAKFAGGTYITTGESSGTLTITHDATNRTSDTDSSSPAFGADIEVYDELTTNSTGHVTQTQLKTITLPSPVNFTAGSAPGTTAAVGTAGYVPAPAAGTGSTAYFLNGTGTMTIPPNDQGVTSVTATAPISSSGGTTPNITHDTSGVSAGTYDIVTVDTKGHVTSGSNTTKLTASCNKALSLANSWTDMFALSSLLGMGKISEVWVNKVIATTAGGGALSVQVAQAGISGTWNGSAGSQTATNIVYNTIIDTANGELEVRFVSYNPSNGYAGYKCQARVLNTQGTVEITVTWNNVDTSIYPATFTDLT